MNDIIPLTRRANMAATPNRGAPDYQSVQKQLQIVKIVNLILARQNDGIGTTPCDFVRIGIDPAFYATHAVEIKRMIAFRKAQAN